MQNFEQNLQVKSDLRIMTDIQREREENGIFGVNGFEFYEVF